MIKKLLSTAQLGLLLATVSVHAQEAAPAAKAGSPAPKTDAPAAPKTEAPKTDAPAAAKPEAPKAAEPALPKASNDGQGAPTSNPLLEAPPVNTLPALALPPTAAPTPTSNVTINLINALVKKGILTHGEAEGMITQAAEEAASVQAQLAEVAAPPVAEGDVRVTYIPETVKNQMRELIKQDVLAQVKSGDLQLQGFAPEWAERIKFFGDIRLRFEADLFPTGNENSGSFPNFNAINTGAPFDVAGTVFSPQYNVDQDRYRFKLRARLGADIDLDNHWYAGFRIGTGQDNSPVTQNQGLGVANNGQGGNFSKYSLWLDRAFIKYERGSPLADGVAFTVGRFDNPFFSTSLTWTDEIGFDGLALRGSKELFHRGSVFFTGGMFPIFNTEFNFASNQPSKFDSTDRYLYAAQLGADFKLAEKVNAKVAVAYYDFHGIEGKLSDPFIPLTAQDAGNTDGTRPSFAQRGNTYRALRQITPSVINGFGTSMQYQYFGLATPFKEAVLTGKVDFNLWEPYQLSLLGEYAKNTEWDKAAINDVAVNNRGPNQANGQTGDYGGDDTAWLLRAQFGKEKFEKAGDWRAWIDYRYVGSDAVVDAFNDDDFGDGGTNVEGFSLGAQMALSKRVSVGARWFSSNEITGPPLKNDIFMFDLSAKF